MTRRTCLSLLAATAVAPNISWSQAGAGGVALYASVGPVLTHYDVDVAGATLSRRDSVTLPANVQYVWPHVPRQYLYAASSNSAPGPGGVVGDKHHVSAFRLDGSGALTPHGQPLPLPSRPIHLTTDIPSDKRPASRPSSITPRRTASTAAPSTSTRAGVCWLRRTSGRCS